MIWSRVRRCEVVGGEFEWTHFHRQDSRLWDYLQMDPSFFFFFAAFNNLQEEVLAQLAV